LKTDIYIISIRFDTEKYIKERRKKERKKEGMKEVRE
jgi:hypothetical protein